MADSVITQPNNKLRLEISADESVIVIKTPAEKEMPVVTSQVDPLTGKIGIIAKLTQAQYDAIAVKDDSTLYVIVP